MKKHFVGILSISLLLGGCQSSGPHSPQQPSGTPSPQVVSMTKVSRQDVERQVQLPAELRARQESMVSARVSGILHDVQVDIGDTVNQGQVVAVVDAPELSSETDQARALVEQADSEIGVNQAAASAQLSQIGVNQAEYQKASKLLSSAQSELSGTESQVKLTRQTYDRLRSIYDIDPGLVPAHDLEVAQAQLDAQLARQLTAKRQVAAGRQGLEVFKRQEQVLHSQTLAAQQRTSSSEHRREAQEAAARKSIQWQEFAKVRAPFRGVVIARQLDSGALVAPGKSIITIADLRRVRARFGVPESEASLVHAGSAVALRLDGVEQPVLSKITRVSEALDKNTRTMAAEIELSNPEHKFRPGMIATVDLTVASHRNVLALPTSAVVSEKKKRFVYLVRENKVSKQPVEVGFSNAHWTEITSGIDENQEVVLEKQDRLTDGGFVTYK